MPGYHKTIIFTKVPCLGHFRYKDKFQIYPLFPKVFTEFPIDYPVVLEFKLGNQDRNPEKLDERGNLNTLELLTDLDHILLILSTISNNQFFRYRGSKAFWGITLVNQDLTEIDFNFDPKWTLPYYGAQDSDIHEFTKVNFPPIDQVDYFPYYFENPNLDIREEQPLTLPSKITSLLDAFYSRNSEQSKMLMDAMNFFETAVDLRNTKKTVSALAAFTALETMVNYEFRNQNVESCNSCSQPKYKVAQKFKDYLMKYIGPSDENKKKFNEFYKLRSKIVHKGERFPSEDIFSNLSQNDRHKDHVTQIELIQMARLGILQWLLANA